MRNKVVLNAVAAAALVFTAACSSDSGEPAGQATTTGPPAAAATDTAAAQEHNNADLDFVRNMIPHHEQAVEMSDILLAKPDIDPRVVDLANEIKAAQGPEIDQMQTWLDQWGDPDVEQTPPAGAEHGGHGAHGEMAGMLTEQELNQLRDAEGVDASRLFLTQMIAHHDGAVAMAQNEIDQGQSAEAIDLATAIIDTQQREIDTMREILGTL